MSNSKTCPIGSTQGVEKRFPIVVVLENRLLLVASEGHMVDSAGIFDAEGAGHGARIAEKVVTCNKRDLILRCLTSKSAPKKGKQHLVKLLHILYYMPNFTSMALGQ